MKLKSGLIILYTLLLIVKLQAKQTTTADEIYISRINSLKLEFGASYNETVKKHIDEYVANPEQVKQLIIKSKQLFPLIEKQLRIKNAPIDLKYLAATASGLDASAVNAGGASGVWMMAYQLSKMYKLKVTTYIDERRDIVKSTNVAAQHFKDLFSIYKSWQLSIAAYGCSPVMLNKCIRMANNSLYFWDIYPSMPTFCRDLLPKTIATAYILNYYKEHGIKLKETHEVYTENTDTVLVNKWLSFQQIANTLAISVDDLRALNPVFKKDVIPYTIEGYYIRIPKGKAKDFVFLKDSTYRPEPLVTDFQPVEIQKDNTRSNTEAVAPDAEAVKKAKPVNKTTVTYKVKRGDSLSDVADWFDTTVDDIKKQNKIKGNRLNAGVTLKIKVSANKAAYYRRINKMNRMQKKRLGKKD